MKVRVSPATDAEMEIARQAMLDIANQIGCTPTTEQYTKLRPAGAPSSDRILAHTLTGWPGWCEIAGLPRLKRGGNRPGAFGTLSAEGREKNSTEAAQKMARMLGRAPTMAEYEQHRDPDTTYTASRLACRETRGWKKFLSRAGLLDSVDEEKALCLCGNDTEYIVSTKYMYGTVDLWLCYDCWQLETSEAPPNKGALIRNIDTAPRPQRSNYHMSGWAIPRGFEATERIRTYFDWGTQQEITQTLWELK